VTRAIPALDDVPVLDGHCHPLLPAPLDVSSERFADCFSEGRPGAMAGHVAHTGYFRRAVRALADRLDCEATAPAVLARRRALGPDGGPRMLADSRVATLLVDTGYPPGAMPLAEMRQAMPCAIHEVFRIETCAQRLLARGLPCDDFLAAFDAELRAAAERAVALKSIIAYRSGLAVREWSAGDVARVYDAVVERVRGGGADRLTEKPLLDTLFAIALAVCRDTGRPLQVHSGFGDPDIDLIQANPLHLRPILEDPRWAGVRIAILHMAYPYTREAAFMAAVWPQVYVDLSLALPFLGPAAVLPLTEMISLAPAGKLMYGSDVGALPELFALAADWARAALGEALGWLIDRGGLTGSEGVEVGRRILGDNASALYGVAV